MTPPISGTGGVIHTPEWIALGREVDLAVEQLGNGITALGRANHAQSGLYNQAFFGISIGLERLAKLVIVADFAVGNSGAYPSNSDLKTFGHDLVRLLSTCDGISNARRNGKEHSERPSDLIHAEIIDLISDFARLTRYYNLNLISGRGSQSVVDPIAAWWRRVGGIILERHYRKKDKERHRSVSEALGKEIASVATVLHTSEEGAPISDFGSLMLRGAETSLVQRYGRLYTLQIVRWLSYLLHDLSYRGGYELRIGGLFGLHERVVLFMRPDQMLLSRKRWTLY